MEDPYLLGPYAPVDEEIDATLTVVAGEVPRDLHGTYVRNAVTTVSGDTFIPSVCLPTQPPITCPQLGSLLGLVIPGATGACTQGNGGCDCQITVNTQLNDVGTYSASGNVVTTVSGGVTQSYWYCAQTGSLEYRGLPTNPTDNDTTYVLTP